MAVQIVGEAGVRMRPETSGFQAEAETGILGPLGGVAKRAAGLFAAAFAAEKVGDFLKDSITVASDLSESTSKVGVVFGDAAQQVLDFASTSASSLGLAESAALEATGTFGNLLRSTGLAEDAAADMSVGMVQLAGDLASFNNASPEEALEALRAGLLGEAEPLKRFGVNLDQAAIKARAVEMGLAASEEAVTDAAAAQAAYALIMEQTGLAQGDFARTSDGLANQQRIIAAQFTDLKANVGGLFVPALANAAGMVSGTLMPALTRLTSGLPALGDALGSIGDMWRVGFSDGPQAVNEATAGLSGLPFVIGQVAGTVGDLGAIFQEGLADGAVSASLASENSLQGLAAKAGALTWGLRGNFLAAFDGIREALGPAFAQISEAFSGAFGGGEGGGGIFATIGTVLETVVPIIEGYITRWADVFAAVIPVIADVISGLAPVISDLVAQIGPVLQQLMPIVSQVAGVFATTLVTVLNQLAPVIPPLVAAIGQVAGILAGAFLQVLTALAPVIPTLATALGQIATIVAGAFASALQAIAPVLPTIATVIGQVATMLAGALASALQAVIPILPPLIDAFMQIAQALLGALMGALQAILPLIPTLVEVFLQLVQTAIVPLLPLLPMLAQLFAQIITALAPLIPPLIQIVMLIIQLAIAAIQPLLPFLPVIIGLFMMLMQALMPIIGILIQIIGGFIGFAATIISIVIGFVSSVIGFFQGLWSGITGAVQSIVDWVSDAWQGMVDGLTSIFEGVSDTIGGIFEGIGDGIRSAINAIIGGINDTIIAGINVVIDGVNFVNPFDDIPHIPNIPTFRTGGIFDLPEGQAGLALLHGQELVASTAQRATANDLLGQLLNGAVPGAAAGVRITNNITQQPGEDGATLAARVSQGVVWNLNNGVTRRVGAGAVTP